MFIWDEAKVGDIWILQWWRCTEKRLAFGMNKNNELGSVSISQYFSCIMRRDKWPGSISISRWWRYARQCWAWDIWLLLRYTKKRLALGMKHLWAGLSLNFSIIRLYNETWQMVGFHLNFSMVAWCEMMLILRHLTFAALYKEASCAWSKNSAS